MIVGIVVSEMRYDYIYRYWDKYSDGGFKKLINNGTFCKNAHHDYLLSEASAGYATIATGCYPEEHGMVSDFWYDRLKDQVQFSIHDRQINSVGGAYESGKFSPSGLQVSTLADELRLSNKFKSKLVSVSLDPRASVIMGGHTSKNSYWYDPSSGNWMSSSYYCDSLPSWVNDFNAKGFADIYLDKTWEPLFPVEQYESSLEDDNPYETGIRGQKTFPYDLAKLSRTAKNERNYALLKTTPYGNTYTRDLAVASVISEELGQDEYTDFLFVNFAAGAYAGEFYNSWSVEMQDIYIQLDREIEHFLNFLDDEVGLKNVLIYLTAENATVNEPSFLLDKRVPSGYFSYNSAISLLKTYLNVVYGSSDWVKFYYSKQIYLNTTLIEDSKLSFSEFEDRVARFMVQFEGVGKVLTSTDLMKNNYTRGAFERIQKTYNQKRSGDIILHLNPGWVEKGADRALASAFHYDSHVPLIFYGWKTGREEIISPVSLTDIVPTLSHFLNLSRPGAVQGNIISDLVD